MKRVFTEINLDYVNYLYKVAKEVFGGEIYVKSEEYPCGWDIISFEYCDDDFDVMVDKIDSSQICQGTYCDHKYEGKTLYEVIQSVGMRGWCYERSDIYNIK